MASLPILTVLEQSDVSPPPATVGDRSLPLTFFDIPWLPYPPVHHLFFYEFPLSTPQFMEKIVPTLKNSLSTTLQRFFPFAGNLIIYPTGSRAPEIRYVEGDTVAVILAETTLDFNDLVGNHPRDCDNFQLLIPQLGKASKVFDYVTIPVFSIQLTCFPSFGFSIGMTNHHSLGDASTRFSFLNAWTSIARSGSDESFLADHGTLPFYDRVIKHPELDGIQIKQAKLEAFGDGFNPPCLSRPSDKLRTTFVLTRAIINQMKKWVSTQEPTLQYVSTFTVSCAYVWSCMAKLRNDGLQVFGFVIDCRARLDPKVPDTYFGNCIAPCAVMEKANLLTEKEGFVTAAKLIGELLHKMLNDKDGIMKDAKTWFDFAFKGNPKTIIVVAGTPRLRFYDTDFGWGKPKKYETISTDYGGAFSLNTSKESNQDLEIGMSLSSSEMEAFIPIFTRGLENFI